MNERSIATYAKLGALAEVSERTIFCVVHHKPLSLALIEKVCAALGIAVEQLDVTVSSYRMTEEEYKQLQQRFANTHVILAPWKPPYHWSDGAYARARYETRWTHS